ncbi:EAL domain-containing protein [Aquibacillus kalidii]|uniref:EAL domain-containing protein n=1 Tax=Aquibacillus kalidii TaxID=2762597 RepID=UPI0016490784|nr:EAL domain-containing protein [Aquibacillus kalidii]
MNNNRRSIGFFLLIICVYSLLWIYIFQNNDWIRSLLASVGPLITGVISLYWLMRAYKQTSGKSRNFWLLLSNGVLLYILANTIWIMNQILFESTNYTNLSYIIWLFAYSLFLIALIYKVKLLSLHIRNNPYTFYVFVFMIFAVSVVMHYLVTPIMANNESLVAILATMMYPIFNLSYLFLIALLYFLSHQSPENKNLLFIIVGIFLQVIADLSYTFQTLNGIYQTGSWIDLIYMVALLLIGFSGQNVSSESYESKWEMNDFFKKMEDKIPYAIAILLLVLVTSSYDWKLNYLSAGLSIIFVIIIVRQVKITASNKKLMSEFRHLAYHDLLTGLKNRTSFSSDLGSMIAEANHNRCSPAILLIDLDRFKNVNDTLGHVIGDQILTLAGERLKSIFSIDSIYRIGGDEFVIVIENATEQTCISIANKVLNTFKKPFEFNQYEIAVTPSIGISLYPDNGKTRDLLLKNADTAMYLAKASGKNNYRFFTNELNEKVTRKVELENELRKALDQGQFSLVYQPKIELKSGVVIGMEALLRWDHPKLGHISPQEFIPILEETGNIVSVGEWVLRTACMQTKKWHEKGFSTLAVSVNVSVRQLEHYRFIEMVKEVLKDTGLNSNFIELEITESIMKNVDDTITILSQLRELGLSTSIDDFGTGYSSLHILKELPIDAIKIDKSFVQDISDQTSLSMVKTIIDIGLNLKLDVIAEGIEEEYQAKILDEQGCNYGQGYLYSKPIDPKQFELYLEEQTILLKEA